jgi:hypothetical protein
MIPSESWEQQWLFAKARELEAEWPDLKWLYAVPNGATTGKREGARLKAEGLKAGVPDLCLPVARGRWHGLYVEMKRQNGTVRDLSPAQRRWLAALERQGYLSVWKAGHEAALAAILEYLSLEK